VAAAALARALMAPAARARGCTAISELLMRRSQCGLLLVNLCLPAHFQALLAWSGAFVGAGAWWRFELGGKGDVSFAFDS